MTDKQTMKQLFEKLTNDKMDIEIQKYEREVAPLKEKVEKVLKKYNVKR